jgi:hypothetical protein
MVFHGMTTKQERDAYAKAAINTVLEALLSDDVVDVVRLAIYEAPSMDCAVEALTAAIEKLKEDNNG